MKVYCVKCRARREMKDAKAITIKNGIITNEQKNIIALNSASKNEEISKIVPQLKQGAIVTTPATMFSMWLLIMEWLSYGVRQFPRESTYFCSSPKVP